MVHGAERVGELLALSGQRFARVDDDGGEAARDEAERSVESRRPGADDGHSHAAS